MIDIRHLTRITKCVQGTFEHLSAQRGQALAEYILILAFVFMACVLALGFLGLELAGQLDSFASAFP